MNRLTDRSDIDIAIGSSSVISHESALDISLQLTHILSRECSVIDINKMEGVILEEVLTKGQIIRNYNPDLLAKYIGRMLTFTEDILPLQKAATDKYIGDYLSE